MKQKLPFYLLLTFYAMSGCKKEKTQELQPSLQEPHAKFTFTGSHFKAPCEINFVNLSSNGESYNWYFGDGDSSHQENPVHQYKKAGQYNVVLKVKNSSGLSQCANDLTITAPEKLRIEQITLLEFPLQNFGSNWDGFPFNPDPDIYFKITNHISQSLYTNIGEVKNNIRTSILPLNWTLNPPFSSKSLQSKIHFVLMDDDDFQEHQEMGKIEIDLNNLSSGNNPYPAVLNLQNGKLKIKLNLIWE